jgi:hypothetical protein
MYGEPERQGILRRDQSGQRIVEGARRKLHEIRDISPHNGGPNGTIGINPGKHRAIERELSEILARHVIEASWRWMVRFVIDDENKIGRDGHAVDLAGDPFCAVLAWDTTDDGNLRATAERE